MKVYILSIEPYHDNGRIERVTVDALNSQMKYLMSMLKQWNASLDESRHNSQPLLVEWDVNTQKAVAYWKATCSGTFWLNKGSEGRGLYGVKKWTLIYTNKDGNQSLIEV